jgi:hypothetical protein
MHRRHFLRYCGTIAVTGIAAGCADPEGVPGDDDPTDRTETGTDGDAQVTLQPAVAVGLQEVDLVTAPNRELDDVEPVVTPTGSEHVDITATEFERTRANDMNELSHSGTRERARPRLEADQTWTVGISFDGVDVGTIDYYTVTVQANVA